MIFESTVILFFVTTGFKNLSVRGEWRFLIGLIMFEFVSYLYLSNLCVTVWWKISCGFRLIILVRLPNSDIFFGSICGAIEKGSCASYISSSLSFFFFILIYFFRILKSFSFINKSSFDYFAAVGEHWIVFVRIARA